MEKTSKKRQKNVMLMKSHILTIIKRVIMPIITPSKKTSPNLGNFFIDD